MSYNATVKFQYINDTEPSYNKHFPEIVDQMTVNIEAPAQDLNIWQYYELFKSFLRSVGFADYSIMEGACRLAFNDSNREDDMKKMMEEYDLQDKQLYTDKEYESLQEQLNHAEETAMHWKDKYLKEISTRTLDLDSIMPPWGHSDMEALQYTEDEINAMCDAAEEAEKERCIEMAEREYEWVKLFNTAEQIIQGWEDVPGSEEACAKGCKCPVMDNAEMPDDRKWVNSDCPLHGKVTSTPHNKTEPLSCDKDDPREECQKQWNDFWEEQYYPEEVECPKPDENGVCPPGTVYINGECAYL